MDAALHREKLIVAPEEGKAPLEKRGFFLWCDVFYALSVSVEEKNIA